MTMQTDFNAPIEAFSQLSTDDVQKLAARGRALRSAAAHDAAKSIVALLARLLVRDGKTHATVGMTPRAA